MDNISIAQVAPRQDVSKSLVERYRQVRDHTITICAPLKIEDFVVQPVVDVSPPKWHMAHTTWFFEEFFLSKYKEGYTRFHPRYAYLFNSYYEAVGDRVLRPNRGNMSRPTVDEIIAYRNYVDEHMTMLIPLLSHEARELLILGLNHEQQHQELLLTDIKFILGHNPLFPPYDETFEESSTTDEDHGYLQVQEGNYTVGFRGDGFFFDNEKECHRVYLPHFEIRKSLVTNGEYLKFMNAGGYNNPQYWHSDGWTWVQENEISSPLYWHKMDGEWCRYSLGGLATVHLVEPVTHVNFYEAAAFAEWAGMRLPTEFEWEVASDGFRWGERWEHTNSAYLPYPGFLKADGAIGEYNGKFMINQMVLRGSSIATSSGHSRKTYRNFFSPELQWQFSGIRLCKK